MILKYTGVVEDVGDDCRCDGDVEGDGALSIGGVDFLSQVADHADKFTGPVTIAFADERFAGEGLAADLGWGYSEYTPVDSDLLGIRGSDVNLIEILRSRYVGYEITLWIADEPIDLGDSSSSH